MPARALSHRGLLSLLHSIEGFSRGFAEESGGSPISAEDAYPSALTPYHPPFILSLVEEVLSRRPYQKVDPARAVKSLRGVLAHRRVPHLEKQGPLYLACVSLVHSIADSSTQRGAAAGPIHRAIQCAWNILLWGSRSAWKISAPLVWAEPGEAEILLPEVGASVEAWARLGEVAYGMRHRLFGRGWGSGAFPDDAEDAERLFLRRFNCLVYAQSTFLRAMGSGRLLPPRGVVHFNEYIRETFSSAGLLERLDTHSLMWWLDAVSDPSYFYDYADGGCCDEPEAVEGVVPFIDSDVFATAFPESAGFTRCSEFLTQQDLQISCRLGDSSGASRQTPTEAGTPHPTPAHSPPADTAEEDGAEAVGSGGKTVRRHLEGLL
eukprot:TRINITY_DN52235_c0_g1_i1.p1 TRINITY_DN52235_c0_g1~~TRINITY_DN52235_c0_g1_i1.p1  ORF type:complete len:430 (+),score=83.97 TRINITY_DN52235_c0_g1_i1:159-1292(+)